MQNKFAIKIMLVIFFFVFFIIEKSGNNTLILLKKPCLCFAYFAYLYYVTASITAHQRKIDKIRLKEEFAASKEKIYISRK